MSGAVAAGARPAMSVVVVSPGRFANVRRTVRHLRAQTAAARLELVLVAASAGALADHAPGELDGFAAVTVVAAGPIADVDRAAGLGIRRAAAPVVGVLEDHAYPEPGWADAMLAAHAGPWAAVGSGIVNANPDTGLSWANLLIAYGPYTEPVDDGERAAVPGHNLSFKASALAHYGDGLVDRMGRDGGLLDDLRARGHRLYLAAGARVHHVNPSTLAATAEVRVNAGRLYGALRAAGEGWSLPKRLAYAAGGPLIPLVRFVRVRRELFGGGRRREVARRALPSVFLGLVLDGLGQMAGYALGAGESRARLARFEFDRLQHLTPAERRAAAADREPPAPAGVQVPNATGARAA